MNLIKKLCLLMTLLATIYSCEKENFNYVIDEAIPEPPVIIKEEIGVMRFSFNDNPLDTLEGFGVTDNDVYVISNGEVECKDDGGFSSTGSFTLIFFQFDGIASVVSLVFSTEVNGEEISLIAEGSFGDCGRMRPTIELSEVTDTSIAGTITGDFYTISPETTEECEPFLAYYGNFTVAFSIPIQPCT